MIKKSFLFFLFLQYTIFANDIIKIDFNNLKLYDFVKIVSKVTNKNIFINTTLDQKINFISNKTIKKDQLYALFKLVLKTNNLKIINQNNILIVIPDNYKATKVVYLKNSDAQSVANILNQLNKSNKNISIIANLESNSVVLKGQKDQVIALENIIKSLDIDKQQVYVQARIIEISETKTNNVGVQYGLNGYSATSNGLVSFSSSLNSNGAVIPLNAASLSGYGYDAKTLHNNLSLGATINLLKKNNALDVVSQPSILCINNKQSSIYVGETRTVKIGTTTTSGGNISDKYKREDIGLKLSVKPRISSENKVTLDIEAVIEDITNGISDQPNTVKKVVKTTAIVNNAESVIIGGLIKNKKETINDKVAFFGDIPILGSLFRNNYDINDKINLVIIITPYIIPKSKDLTYVRNKLIELKQLEDSYTKKLLKKLNKNKVQKNNKKSKQKTYQELHKQRVKELFDI
jgi:general secretion pathway protein D